ncbi:MAG: molybdopterin converting factor subunit 1 [Thermoplasmata archaeon]|nr:MAG: molybdopterin converting factor subunit 1 [Thermoplasmata archaeon]
MDIRVRYFAAHKEITGVPEETVSVPEGTTVDGLMEAVMALHPELEPIRRDTMVSVNRGVGSGGIVLKEGDDVALFPPIQGG